MWINFYDPHTSADRNTMLAWEPHSQPTSSLAGHPWSCRHHRQLEQRGSWVGKVQIKQLGQRRPLWLWHIIEAHVVILLACVGDGAAAKSLGCAETATIWPWRLSHIDQHDQPSHDCVYRPSDHKGWYNKMNPNANSNLGLTAKVWISGKKFKN